MDDGQVIIEAAPVSTGRDACVTAAGGYRFFAGWRSDPFFFDTRGALNDLQFTGDDFFIDKDVCSIQRQKGAVYQQAASYGFPLDVHDFLKDFRFEPNRMTVAGRTALEGRIVHVTDVLDDPDHLAAPAMSPMRKTGARTVLGVPLLREGVPIGIIILVRRSVRPFTGKQIELVSTFADQAVIAIENVRLFDEIQASRSPSSAFRPPWLPW